MLLVMVVVVVVMMMVEVIQTQSMMMCRPYSPVGSPCYTFTIDATGYSHVASNNDENQCNELTAMHATADLRIICI